MFCITSYNYREKIYLEHLREFKGIKFTHREIDVIACIMHNRTDKKIASILYIAPKTVSVHVCNLMQKLQCNSRDYFIDFIEKSGRIQYVRKYYLSLLFENNLRIQLSKIGKEINRESFIIVYNIEDEPDKSVLLDKLIDHLKLANIIIKQKSSNPGDIDILACLNEIEENNYYLSVLELINKLINKNEIDEFIIEFKEQYQSIYSLYENKDIPEYSLTSVSEVKSAPIKFISYIIFGIALITIILLFLLNFNKQDLVNTNSISALEVNKEFAKFVDKFSADNARKEKIQENHNLVKRVEKIVNHLDEQPISAYFNGPELLVTELLDCLYSLHALSNYYLYHYHDGPKARKLLEKARNLVHNYISSRSKLQINFDKLNEKELHTELSIVEDLSMMYTRIVYLLARTYIYQGDKKEAVKYFELAKYLGKKTGVFEGYLSNSGLEIIKMEQIERDIESKNYVQAEKMLEESIKLYKELQVDNTKYKLDYKPGCKEPKLISPKEDIYTQVECSEQIIKRYSSLLSITNSPKRQSVYIKEIAQEFTGTKDVIGIFIGLKNLSNKKVASIYNTLGSILLKLYDYHLDFKEFRAAIVRELNLTKEEDLKIIQQIFDLACSFSRNTEFTKADSYDGLIRVYNRLIKQDQLSEQENRQLLTIVAELKKNRDDINKKLNRNFNERW